VGPLLTDLTGPAGPDLQPLREMAAARARVGPGRQGRGPAGLIRTERSDLGHGAANRGVTVVPMLLVNP
jgi:hypothetical protein